MQKKWTELENLVNTQGINQGWPPNRGFVDIEIEPLTIGTEFDRYGGYIESGVFKDNGTFIAPIELPFPQRALPNSTLSKPYKKYKVIKDIPNTKKGKAIPWFGQPGNGIQYELPEGIDDLITGGYIELIQ